MSFVRIPANYKHDLNYGVLQLKYVILRSAPGPSSVFVPFFRVYPSFLNAKYVCRSKSRILVMLVAQLNSLFI